MNWLCGFALILEWDLKRLVRKVFFFLLFSSWILRVNAGLFCVQRNLLPTRIILVTFIINFNDECCTRMKYLSSEKTVEYFIYFFVRIQFWKKLANKKKKIRFFVDASLCVFGPCQFFCVHSREWKKIVTRLSIVKPPSGSSLFYFIFFSIYFFFILS